MHQFDPLKHQSIVLPLLQELEQSLPLDRDKILKLQKKHHLPNGDMLSKTDIIAAYKTLAGKHGLKPYQDKVVRQLQMKPVRTVSGVAPVTVLTKPFPCPGQCIFCPNDVRMPKSYLASEPGAQRAEHNFFDPYLQTYNRVKALYDMGHRVDKVELIVLGGSWSYYPKAYQIWFIKECFRALNEFGLKDDREQIRDYYQQIEQKISELNVPALSDDRKLNEQLFAKYKIHGAEITSPETYNQIIQELFVEPEKKVGLDKYQSADWDELKQQHQLNETADVRCVGLVLETRPDLINQKEAIKLRSFGCTKVQLGIQSLDDEVLKKNKRGHGVEESARAMNLLRRAGFKLHIHWMPNLYGSNPEKDKKDYLKLFEDERFKPDEIKIYPCSLLESAKLMQYFQQGKWRPYTHDELLNVLTFCLTHTPPYCRVTRVIRDIPSFNIVAGNKKTNFRQIAQQELEKTHQQSQNIRAREIRRHEFDPNKVFYEEIAYQTAVSTEIFMQYLAPVKTDQGVQNKLLGFLRLSLPKQESFVGELDAAAVIREVHVYGSVVGLGKNATDRAQHLGLGSKLIEKAKQRAAEENFSKIGVISAVGTREYYRERGFKDKKLYQISEN
jgi:elongator complex protein 3